MAPLNPGDFGSTYLQLFGYSQVFGIDNYVDILTRDVRLAQQVATVPEPSFIALFGAGLAGLGALSWRRRKSRQNA